jgi:hypothetical protein
MIYDLVCTHKISGTAFDLVEKQYTKALLAGELNPEPLVSDSGLHPKSSLSRIQEAWRQPYLGTSHPILEGMVRSESVEFDKTQHPYAKMMPIVQSSGAGKSQLIDRFSETHVGGAWLYPRSEEAYDISVRCWSWGGGPLGFFVVNSGVPLTYLSIQVSVSMSKRVLQKVFAD